MEKVRTNDAQKLEKWSPKASQNRLNNSKKHDQKNIEKQALRLSQNGPKNRASKWTESALAMRNEQELPAKPVTDAKFSSEATKEKHLHTFLSTSEWNNEE